VPAPSGRGQACPHPDRPGAARRGGFPWKSAVFRGFAALARLMLGKERRGTTRNGSKTMQKFETLAFAAGFILTGLLSFVALPLA
jgi:hypothetical protein